ncbi:helix-turn-helix domain-containing protein [Streptomyces sp. AK04-3B]|uniref:helix-turn-helix domain-containing protein n=1 Tax=Streptomyces sp. AK04-3B TaxID=3028650 RepID=UPI0039F5494F
MAGVDHILALGAVGLPRLDRHSHFGGRPPALDDDALAVARDRRRRTPPQSVTAIARDLGVGRSTLYRALSEVDQVAETLRVHPGGVQREASGKVPVGRIRRADTNHP